MPTLALATGLLALMLSIAAIVLATIANRRHMEARRAWPSRTAVAPLPDQAAETTQAGTSHPNQLTDGEHLVQLQARCAEVEQVIAQLAGEVAELSGPVHAHGARLDGLADQFERRAVALAERTEELQRDLHVADERREVEAINVAVQLDMLGEQVTALRDRMRSADPTALRHVAVVRYDAFADVGGRLSYSLAVLDDTASGFVVTTLAGKAEVRTYVRAITQGDGDGTLTDEEQQAIGAARHTAGSRS